MKKVYNLCFGRSEKETWTGTHRLQVESLWQAAVECFKSKETNNSNKAKCVFYVIIFSILLAAALDT